jgi:alpha-ketoglutarate-dependent taurine dioxygenase
MKGFENSKPSGKLNREQTQRESELLSQLMGETEVKDLIDFEGDLAKQRSELLFRVTTKIEDTQNALKQAEELVKRLKKYLNQLQGLHQILSK